MPVWLIAWGLAFPVAAKADAIDGVDSLPPSQLSGWFSNNAGSQALFPLQLDPSQPWTSAGNIATMNAWLSLVGQASSDPALLAQLVGLGMIDSGGLVVSAPLTPLAPLNSQNGASSAPEPARLPLIGTGALLLAIYGTLIFKRRRPRREG